MKRHPFPTGQKFYAGDLVQVIGSRWHGIKAFVVGSYIELHGHVPSPEQMKFHSNYNHHINSFSLDCEEEGRGAWFDSKDLEMIRMGLKHRHVLGYGL